MTDSQSFYILVVEDSQLQATMLRNILERAGYHVILARSGNDGLKTLHEHHVSLVISDINMPGMNGFELCRLIKMDEKLWNVPVILVTALLETRNIIMALSEGADGYITKPFVEATLLKCIHSLLYTRNHRRLSEERRKVHIECSGKEYNIAVSCQRMLPLMLSLYENVVTLNQELTLAHNQLNILNEEQEKKIMERTASLKEIEEKYRSIFDGAGDGIVLIDDGGMIVDCNREFEQQTGRTLEQFQQAHICDFLSQYSSDISKSKFQELVQSGESYTNDLELRNSKGELVSIECRTRSVTIGGKHYLQSITRDVTERKLTEAKLAEQLNELQRWNDAMVDREMRNIELKHEINVLLAQIGEPPRYPSAEQSNTE